MSVLARDHYRHLVVQDLDRQVVALFAEESLALPLQHDAGPVMRVDDVVAGLERALDGTQIVTCFRGLLLNC
jgi:hypothetical protein